MEVPTITLVKEGAFCVVNEEDAGAWLAEGWSVEGEEPVAKKRGRKKAAESGAEEPEVDAD